MATATKLVATTRDRAGKGMARETRRQNRIPCVIYGGKQPPQMISIEAKLLERDVQTSSFVTRTYLIEPDGQSHSVLPRDVQFHPVTDKPIHIDFLRIDASSVVTVSVPFDFANPEASPGIKRGGVLNIVHHEIELRCRPDKIPAHITHRPYRPGGRLVDPPQGPRHPRRRDAGLARAGLHHRDRGIAICDARQGRG